VTIIIHTVPFEVDKDDITYEQIFELAPDAQGPIKPGTKFTITWRRGHGNKDRELAPGESVKVKEGMLFDVRRTDKS
jgi:hypothetical protein